MESFGDCAGHAEEAVRVKVEPEEPPTSVDCYYWEGPIKEERDIKDETLYVKEEVLCVKSEEQEASCSGGVSAAAKSAGLYAGHTTVGDLVLGPEVFHRPVINTESRVDCYYWEGPIKEERDIKDETLYVKEEVLCVKSEEQEASCSGGVSAAAKSAGLYAGHTTVGDLVLGPEVFHRPVINTESRGELEEEKREEKPREYGFVGGMNLIEFVNNWAPLYPGRSFTRGVKKRYTRRKRTSVAAKSLEVVRGSFPLTATARAPAPAPSPAEPASPTMSLSPDRVRRLYSLPLLDE